MKPCQLHELLPCGVEKGRKDHYEQWSEKNLEAVFYFSDTLRSKQITNQGSQSPGWDSNQRPSEYEPGLVTTKQRHLVI
jgi:hypothetical protein